MIIAWFVLLPCVTAVSKLAVLLLACDCEHNVGSKHKSCSAGLWLWGRLVWRGVLVSYLTRDCLSVEEQEQTAANSESWRSQQKKRKRRKVMMIGNPGASRWTFPCHGRIIYIVHGECDVVGYSYQPFPEVAGMQKVEMLGPLLYCCCKTEIPESTFDAILQYYPHSN